MNLQSLLEKSTREHSHLCPRQILGVRMGLYGMKSLGFNTPTAKRRLLVIVESDGCFADGITAATDCTVGHRTLRVEDYGKTAATFVDVETSRAFRLAPALDVRQKAYVYAPAESRRYLVQMQGYQIMPDDEMFTVNRTQLIIPVEAIVSKPGMRVNCDVCGEEIMNEREIKQDGLTLCRACMHGGYYSTGRNIILAHIPQKEAALQSTL
jgi:formylmethanofuran dehydrogenase subunit E